MNASGDQATDDLKRMLQETQDKLRQALLNISELEQTLVQTEQKNEAEQKRLNTEIERLNNILKATN